ncbi:MAG: LysR family transcriptional regulator [Parvibaculum sp.]
MFDWNDLRYFLAVARSGTTLAASRDLRVSQSTVARRIVALEEELRLPLFDKRQSGYVLTEAGTALREAAQQAETSMLAFGAKATAQQRGLSGTVRLTTNDLFANVVLVEAMASFSAAFPDLRLEVVVADRFLDLADGEADIALRVGPRPTEPELFGRCLLIDNWSFYCSRSYADLHGHPKSAEELGTHTIVGMTRDPRTAELIDWLSDYVADSEMPIRPNTYSGALAAIRSGLGVGMMSDVVAARDPALHFCFRPPLPLASEVWLITHERLKNTARIRAVMDFLAGYLTSAKAATPKIA